MATIKMVTTPGVLGNGTLTVAVPVVFDILDAIRSVRIPFDSERAMQAAISQVLTGAGISHEREVSLSAQDRIDFLVGNVGIECKVSGDMFSVASQLARYDQSERIRSLILVTSRALHMKIHGNYQNAVVLLHVGLDV